MYFPKLLQSRGSDTVRHGAFYHVSPIKNIVSMCIQC